MQKETKSSADRISTGHIGLNMLFEGGLLKGSLTIVASVTSGGKSAFVEGLTRHAWLNGISVEHLSLHMGQDELACRYMSALAQVDHGNIRVPERLSQEDQNRIQEIEGMFSGPAWHVYPPFNSMTSQDIRAFCRAEKESHGIDLIIIDGLQNIQNRERQYAKGWDYAGILNDLRAMATELDVAVVITSQLSMKRLYRHPGYRPSLVDLREYGNAGRKADAVILLHRPDVLERWENYEYSIQEYAMCEAIVARNHCGSCGRALLLFHGKHVEFCDVMLSPERLEPAVVKVGEKPAWNMDAG